MPSRTSTSPIAAAGVWTAAHVAAITPASPRTRLITASDARPILPGLDVWDMWPLTRRDGVTAAIAGGVLWFALAAPKQPNPIDRHGLARIRLLLQSGPSWADLGDALPDGFSPGSREWSGSAILDDPATVTLFFTAAGRRGEPKPTVEQRLFQTTGRLDISAQRPAIIDWSPPTESVAADDDFYIRVDQAEGEPGKIKAFRDPAFFRDPASQRCYLVFAASLKRSTSETNGAVGIARAGNAALTRWRLLPPLLHADGVANELERPHVIVRSRLYYVFWSTLHSVFNPSGPAGPTGLYGMVAPKLFGPYTPLNGTGLVAANPASEPLQTYSWLVMDDLRVTSFIDYWDLRGRDPAQHPGWLRENFGGVPAPFFRLALDGDKAWITET